MAAREQQRIDGWDLIRGVGMFFVLLAHALDSAGILGYESPAIIGLTAFFVLSGYLITGILDRDLAKLGRIRFGRFYLNRAFRLMPALFVVLAVYAVVETILDRSPDPIWISLLICLTYLANMPELRDLTGFMRQAWSLSFEEQFYFIWPALLGFSTRRRIAVTMTTVAIVASTCLLIASAVMAGQNVAGLYTLPTTWAATVLLGCLGYLERVRLRAFVKPGTRDGLPLLLVALALALGMALTYDATEPLMYLGGTTATGVVSVIFVLWCEEWREVRQRLLRPVVALGIVSYSAYLWNYPLSMYAGRLVETAWLAVLISMGGSVLLAFASWHLVEQPAQRLKVRLLTRQGEQLPTNTVDRGETVG